MERIKLNDLSVGEIIVHLKERISKLLEEYAYLGLSEELTNDICLRTIEFCKDKYRNTDLYPKMILSRIEGCIKEAGKNIFEDDNEAVNIINNYINRSLTYPDSYKLAKDEIDKLSSMLYLYGYTPSEEVIDALIDDNNILSQILALITEKQRESINKGYLDVLFKSKITTEIIRCYCILNGIDISVNSDKKQKEKTEGFKYEEEIKKIPMIADDELEELVRGIANNDIKARNRLIEANLRLARSIAVKMASKFSDGGNYRIDVDDLIEVANMGLIKAVNKFKPELGSFSTYATAWITGAINRYIKENYRLNAVPVWYSKKLNDYRKNKEELQQIYGDDVSYQMVASKMGISEEKAIEYEIYLVNDAVSFDDYMTDDKDTQFVENLPANYNLEDEVTDNLLAEGLQKLLLSSGISERDLKILDLYRIDGKSMEEIGKIVGYPEKTARSNVSQRLAYAFALLRINPEADKLATYLYDSERGLERLKDYRMVYKNEPKKRYKPNALNDDVDYIWSLVK